MSVPNRMVLELVGSLQIADPHVACTEDLSIRSNLECTMTAIEVYALKRDGSFKGMFLNTAANILDEMLLYLFTDTYSLGYDW